jgi:hypothetical protein
MAILTFPGVQVVLAYICWTYCGQGGKVGRAGTGEMPRIATCQGSTVRCETKWRLSRS